jgi:hypothetical protein
MEWSGGAEALNNPTPLPAAGGEGHTPHPGVLPHLHLCTARLRLAPGSLGLAALCFRLLCPALRLLHLTRSRRRGPSRCGLCCRRRRRRCCCCCLGGTCLEGPCKQGREREICGVRKSEYGSGLMRNPLHPPCFPPLRPITLGPLSAPTFALLNGLHSPLQQRAALAMHPAP